MSCCLEQVRFWCSTSCSKDSNSSVSCDRWCFCSVTNDLQNVPEKNSENRLIFGKDMNNDKVGRFLRQCN